MQQEQAAASTAENVAMREAALHRRGEEEAAAVQHLKSEHGAKLGKEEQAHAESEEASADREGRRR